ncbi:hypothetical protein Prudu_016817 [Prunus dulcis]|uniref:Ubiquitin-like protease family profile domain-containing protein n=1 Tax=Prunus dulcis TaxID=3755 RepID=A0A4Y1RNC1_PRUDU|nr:hypothetical protein Prudu_016817 [Prunus dulcis]
MWKRHSCLRIRPAIYNDKEVFGRERDTFLLPEDITQLAGMEEIGATVVAVYMRYLHDVLKQANMCSMVGFIDPATPSLVLLIVRQREETVYFSGSSARKSCGRAGRKSVIWKTLSGTPKQPSNVECGYYVMRFMRDIIMDPSLAFEKKYAKGNQEAPYPKKQLMKSGMKWAEFVCQIIEQGNY